jgi:hypothetical protein
LDGKMSAFGVASGHARAPGSLRLRHNISRAVAVSRQHVIGIIGVIVAPTGAECNPQLTLPFVARIFFHR